MSKLMILAATVLAAVAALAAPPNATADTAVAAVPVTGSTSDGGTFAGTFEVEQLVVRDGDVFAVGTVSGTLFDADGNATAVETAAVAPVQAQQASCTLLSFSFGPFDIDVAGLVIIHIDPIAADIGLGGLLGTLLCALLGGTAPPPPAEPTA